MVTYATGRKSRAMCDQCGFEVAYITLKTQWDNLRVCPECYEPKHPQLEPRNVVDAQALWQPRPDRDGDLTKFRVGDSIGEKPLQINSFAGSVIPTIDPGAAGSAATFSDGTVSVKIDDNVNVSGSAATFSTGSVVPTVNPGAAGSAVTASDGTVIPTVDPGAAGSAATFSIGTVTISIDAGAWGHDAWGDNTWGD